MNTSAAAYVSPTALLQRSRIRTIALMHELMRRTESANTNQFAKWFDSRTGHWSRAPGDDCGSVMEAQRAGTQDTKKWYRIVRGEQVLSERGLQDLQRLFPDAVRHFDEGPDRIWEAMWGDVDNLWSICGCAAHPFALPDPSCRIDKSVLHDPSLELLADPGLTFDESLYNFESSLLARWQFGDEFSLRDLSESIAFYRIHAAISRLCKTDGAGAYRCVRMCLDDERVSSSLRALAANGASINIHSAVSAELADIEIRRLQNEPAYRASLGVTDFVAHASRPAMFCSHEARMEGLRIG